MACPAAVPRFQCLLAATRSKIVSQTINVRQARADDALALSDLLVPVFQAGDTYTVDPDVTPDAAVAYWTAPGKQVFVVEVAGKMLGTYNIRTNQDGNGAHICNCAYVTAPEAQGKGVARAMLDHSLTQARSQGYRGMQFNFVVTTNTRAIDIWTRAGFETVGRLPDAFEHPVHGYVDALVMYRSLL